MRTDNFAFQLLQEALSAADLRQQVYANNVANVDTPGYKREDVQFETLLQQALSSSTSTDSGTSGTGAQNQAWATVQPVILQDSSTTFNNNGNNVDIDAEMADLAQNQIRYNGLIQDLQMRLSRLKTAINGG